MKVCHRGHQREVGVRSCKPCLSLTQKRWNKANSDRKRDSQYKKNYSITLEQYNAMLVKQNFSCAICGIHQSKLVRRLNVDHDHQTQKVRGLLCWECNKHLGWLENKEFCAKATLYIQGASQCL